MKKRFLATLLTLVMALAMTAPAFAAEVTLGDKYNYAWTTFSDVVSQETVKGHLSSFDGDPNAIPLITVKVGTTLTVNSDMFRSWIGRTFSEAAVEEDGSYTRLSSRGEERKTFNTGVEDGTPYTLTEENIGLWYFGGGDGGKDYYLKVIANDTPAEPEKPAEPAKPTEPEKPAGTDATVAVNAEKYGVTITMNSVLRKGTAHTNSGDIDVYIVEDGSSITIEAMEGFRYHGETDANLGELVLFDSVGYEYDESVGVWQAAMGGDGELEGPINFTAEADRKQRLSATCGVCWVSENGLANLPAGSVSFEQSAEKPTEPTKPAEPTVAGTYTAKKYDTWGQIALNNYGTYSKAVWSALKAANKGVALKEGATINLPEKIGKYTLLPAQVLEEGETLYTVKAGDTLGQIAVNTYKDINMYKAIFERNSDRLANVNSIYEGQVIVLPAKPAK